MKHFKLIQEVDIREILDEIQAQPEAWEAQTGRQDKGTVQRESAAIPIRGLRKSRIRGRRNRDVHETRYTGLARSFRVTVEFLEKFAASRTSALGRARIVLLGPGATVHPHTDRGEYYEVRDRFHLVLRSAGGSRLRAGGEEVQMQERELWWFDNKQIHEASNDSERDRIHLIFDLLPDPPRLARSYRRTSDAFDARMLDLDEALATPVGHQQAAVVQQGVRLYLAGRQSPVRWERLLAKRGAGGEGVSPLRAVSRLLRPGASAASERRFARAMGWCLAHIEEGDLRWEEIPERIAREGSVRQVARAWSKERPGGEE